MSTDAAITTDEAKIVYVCLKLGVKPRQVDICKALGAEQSAVSRRMTKLMAKLETMFPEVTFEDNGGEEGVAEPTTPKSKRTAKKKATPGPTPKKAKKEAAIKAEVEEEDGKAEEGDKVKDEDGTNGEE